MARSGMTTIIETLRGMTNSGQNDYTINNVSFWSDDELQRALDRNRIEVHRSELYPVEAYEGAGTVVYKEYHAQHQNIETIESGTTIFELELATGATVGTANYSMDYTLGVATFTADQGGTAFFLNGRSYDLNAAAADVFRMKAAHAAGAISFSTDNHKIDRSDVRREYLNMAAYYSSQTAPKSVKIVRDDIG